MRSKKTIVLLFFIGSLIIIACQPSSVAETDPIIETETPQIETQEPTLSPTKTLDNLPEGVNVSSKTITIWHPFSGRDAEIIDMLVAKYNQENEDQQIITATSYADEEVLMDSVLASIGSEHVPDLIIAPSFFLSALMEQATLTVLNDEQISWFVEGQEKTIFPVFWNLDIAGEARYGLPFIQRGFFLIYNKSWALELGYSSRPTNPDEFETQNCMAFNQNRFDASVENNGTGGYFYPNDAIALLSWFRAFNGGVEFNNRGESILTTEENQAAVDFLYQLYTEDCAWWTTKEDTPYRYFENRNTLIYSIRSNEMTLQGRMMDENGSIDDWEPIPYPALDGKPIIYFENYSFAIMEKEVVQTDEILSFVEWMIQPEQHLEVVYQSAAFPLTVDEIQKANSEWDIYPYWREILQYIPFLEPVPNQMEWYYIEKVLDDLRWQIIQFGVREEDLSSYLAAAEAVGNAIILEKRFE